MTLYVVLDAGVLGQLVHKDAKTATVLRTFLANKYPTATVVIPEIGDYEVRRSLLKIRSTKSVTMLDELASALQYLPLDTPQMKRASEVWADCRVRSQPLAADQALDGDCIFIAQVQSLTGTVVALTTNRKHLEYYLSCDVPV